ncbi:MAG: hypothetical protein A3D65_00570 [Candidatus Lloydbacteria bacterium RIFCSPHIGHO2_02_FULL_50_13]|uniref:Transposase DDE domain-containing protein n=1 Tax=Candidatus Lloydbacteria bacterium RIFCSPHIGHO2_02_FULL_50_13 TaxID=1798661 RepID=A0A1G2DAB8_9BACT|nr:MAG: hypothetical protein A3D65_00570 [Candidatus Lloydbacteria bacterium RIFCSPHIGHO2_02_FULL_50_13]
MYPILFQKIKHIVTQLSLQYHIIPKKETRPGRTLKIADIDALTLSLYKQTSTRATKKSLYEDFKDMLDCSYKTLTVTINRVAVLTLKLIFVIMRLGKKNAHWLKSTDATDVPVCLTKNGKHHKTMRCLAGWGHSGKGYYYGLKLTMTRDDCGRILSLVFSSPGENDRELFKKANKDLDGIIIADAGYISKELERDMFIEGKRLVLIKPKKNMKKLALPIWAALYKRRFHIEFDFRNLKLFHGLVTSLPRSLNGYLANYVHALLSFMLAKAI